MSGKNMQILYSICKYFVNKLKFEIVENSFINVFRVFNNDLRPNKIDTSIVKNVIKCDKVCSSKKFTNYV